MKESQRDKWILAVIGFSVALTVSLFQARTGLVGAHYSGWSEGALSWEQILHRWPLYLGFGIVVGAVLYGLGSRKVR
jgi:hypothetical protein